MAQTDIFMGAAKIYTACTVPAANTAATLTAGVPAGGVDQGLTGDAASFTLNRNNYKIMVEQTLAEAGVRATEENVSIKFTLSETDYGKLQQFVQGTTLTADTVSNPKKDTVFGGGQANITSNCVAIVGSNVVAGTTYYYMVMLYDAYVDSDFTFQMAKGAETKYEITMRGKAIASRPVGDQVYQILKQHA